MAIIKPLQSVTIRNDNGDDIKYDVLTRAEVSGILAAIGATTESTTSGNPLALTSVESLKAVKEKGSTAQDSTTGKNLVEPFRDAEGTSSYGLTMTPNADGSIRVHGTASNSSATLLSMKSVSIPLPAGTYTFNIGITSSSNKVYGQVVTGAHIFFSRNAKDTFTVASDTTITRLDIGCNAANGEQIDVTIYPQLEIGSSATAYEPYTGGAPAPSPSYPYPIIPLAGYDKKVVLDGTESWDYASATDLCYSNNAIPDGSSADIISDSIVTVVGSSSTKAIAYAVNNHRIIAYKMSDYGVTSANEWKAYLAAHPLTVWYRSTSYDPMADQYYAVGANATNGYIGVATEEKITPLYDGDYLDFVSGVAHRANVVITLDGTQDIGSSVVHDILRFSCSANFPAPPSYNVTENKIKCTVFVGSVQTITANDLNNAIDIYTNSTLYWRADAYADKTAMKAYFTSNPAKVIYNVATPTTETITLTEDLSALYGSITLNGNGTMEVTYRHG